MSAKGGRHKQYYNFVEIQNNLYQQSKRGKNNFKNLLEKILSDENILLAYRTIKSNTGSKTKGTDGYNIMHIAETDQQTFIGNIRGIVSQYKPKAVRRVWIPKQNGKQRPLGIPTIRDRLIQQMFLQVLEPICEGKFYNHSYGFRPLRTTRHALARVQTLININKLHYTVDIDIKGFFDHVNHNLLIKQLWNIGIRDKRVLAIIRKMLKAPIKGEGIPIKGVPQGGILSPLLSNVVLNDLDNWVSDQWDSFKTRHTYAGNDVKITNLRRTSELKEGFIVRYADDFRVMARDYKTAWKWFHAIKGYLKDRLKLDISPEKSKVINLRKHSSEFLGFKIRAIPKGKKIVAKTNVSDKKKKQIKETLKERIKILQKQPNPENVRLYNSTVLGVHQFFKYATHVVIDFKDIEYRLLRTLKSRLRKITRYGYPLHLSKKATYFKFYSGKRKVFMIGGRDALFPIGEVRTTSNFNYSQSLNPYDNEDHFVWDKQIIKLMKSRIINRSLEYMDNRLSVYSMQRGLCAITKKPLMAEDVHCHHKKPVSLGGTDEFKNLVVVHKDIHKLIHATKKETIEKYLNVFSLSFTEIKKLNKLRTLCKLEKLIVT
ncbi:group II intron reverse transcriptase/maturase [Niallia sp. FSL R7-0271]|uniref:group II intron reverse transcriptase/maturase n=1 Tax=Niallia sp. FSL R7-0271 TaxID=2921678 RepID=UPI0030F574B3